MGAAQRQQRRCRQRVEPNRRRAARATAHACLVAPARGLRGNVEGRKEDGAGTIVDEAREVTLRPRQDVAVDVVVERCKAENNDKVQSTGLYTMPAQLV
jgi:hypothetical protein